MGFAVMCQLTSQHRRGIGGFVLAAFAAHAVRRHELGGHQLDGVAVHSEEPGPVVGAGAGFDADGARRQGGDEFVQLGANDLGMTQHDGTAGVDAVQGKHVLGEIDSSVQNAHELPLPSELMMRGRLHFPSWHSPPASALPRARDGEVPFIRWASQ